MKVLWLPIFSMRSYDTGQYAITKDGNFQLTLARLIASDFDEIVVAVPEDCSDAQMFMDQQAHMFTDKHVEYIFMKYGANAVETRKTFWRLNRDFFYSEDILDFDLVITDITGYSGAMSYDLPFINNFNVTKLPELNRPYIDDFFDLDLVEMNNALFTTVINPRQREYILECAPHLADKVFAYTKVAHSEMLPEANPGLQLIDNNDCIFWPFRISDKSYKFDEFIEMFESNELYIDYKLVITDPNDSYKGNHEFVTKIKPTKEQYYQILAARPFVVMLDDIDTVLHPGTIEFMNYNCKLITFNSSLIPHVGMVDSIEEIPQLLSFLSYNNSFPTSPFIYSKDETSKIYSQEFVQTCLNQNS